MNLLNGIINRVIDTLYYDMPIYHSIGMSGIFESETSFEVRTLVEDINEIIVIKSFPKGDDPEYALMCAEELMDKINEAVN